MNADFVAGLISGALAMLVIWMLVAWQEGAEGEEARVYIDKPSSMCLRVTPPEAGDCGSLPREFVIVWSTGQ